MLPLQGAGVQSLFGEPRCRKTWPKGGKKKDWEILKGTFKLVCYGMCSENLSSPPSLQSVSTNSSLLDNASAGGDSHCRNGRGLTFASKSAAGQHV